MIPSNPLVKFDASPATVADLPEELTFLVSERVAPARTELEEPLWWGELVQSRCANQPSRSAARPRVLHWLAVSALLGLPMGSLLALASPEQPEPAGADAPAIPATSDVARAAQAKDAIAKEATGERYASASETISSQPETAKVTAPAATPSVAGYSSEMKHGGHSESGGPFAFLTTLRKSPAASAKLHD